MRYPPPGFPANWITSFQAGSAAAIRLRILTASPCELLIARLSLLRPRSPAFNNARMTLNCGNVKRFTSFPSIVGLSLGLPITTRGPSAIGSRSVGEYLWLRRSRAIFNRSSSPTVVRRQHHEFSAIRVAPVFAEMHHQVHRTSLA